jgi:Mn-dependent DtxR family transcriptional regulator
MELLYYLKQRTYLEIIRLLLDDASGAFTFQKIVQMIGKAPSTISVQLGRLIDHKVVSFDEKRGYAVNRKQTLKRLISKYKV